MRNRSGILLASFCLCFAAHSFSQSAPAAPADPSGVQAQASSVPIAEATPETADPAVTQQASDRPAEEQAQPAQNASAGGGGGKTRTALIIGALVLAVAAVALLIGSGSGGGGGGGY